MKTLAQEEDANLICCRSSILFLTKSSREWESYILESVMFFVNSFEKWTPKNVNEWIKKRIFPKFTFLTFQIVTSNTERLNPPPFKWVLSKWKRLLWFYCICNSVFYLSHIIIYYLLYNLLKATQINGKLWTQNNKMIVRFLAIYNFLQHI